MKIERGMNLGELAQMMGSAASAAEAEEMKRLLLSRYNGKDTDDISDAEWLELLDKSAQ